eukprot:PhM_4_TR1549/c0_g1_i1/m.52277
MELCRDVMSMYMNGPLSAAPVPSSGVSTPNSSQPNTPRGGQATKTSKSGSTSHAYVSQAPMFLLRRDAADPQPTPYARLIWRGHQYRNTTTTVLQPQPTNVSTASTANSTASKQRHKKQTPQSSTASVRSRSADEVAPRKNVRFTPPVAVPPPESQPRDHAEERAARVHRAGVQLSVTEKDEELRRIIEQCDSMSGGAPPPGPAKSPGGAYRAVLQSVREQREATPPPANTFNFNHNPNINVDEARAGVLRHPSGPPPTTATSKKVMTPKARQPSPRRTAAASPMRRKAELELAVIRRRREEIRKLDETLHRRERELEAMISAD